MIDCASDAGVMHFISPHVVPDHLEPRFSVYAWYMPGIYHTYGVLIHMYGIFIAYTWYILGYTMYIHHSGCTLYIQGYTWYVHKVYT